MVVLKCLCQQTETQPSSTKTPTASGEDGLSPTSTDGEGEHLSSTTSACVRRATKTKEETTTA